MSATCLLLSVWGLTPLLAPPGHFKGSQYFKDPPGCHNQCFPQIFASNWQLSHLVSGRRQVTSQCDFGQLSVVHSWPDRRKEEGWTDKAKTISPSKSSAEDNKIWKSITKICVRTESLSVYYVYLKVTKGHNSISSWCSATKPVLICKFIFLLNDNKIWKSITKIFVRTEKRDGRTDGKATDGRTTPKQYPPWGITNAMLTSI